LGAVFFFAGGIRYAVADLEKETERDPAPQELTGRIRAFPGNARDRKSARKRQERAASPGNGQTP
jgi:hypothetical protein